MTTPVTIIGLGPMGQSMARAYLSAGHPVTVWNRTASRADALVSEGAARAATPEEALAASPLVILSLTDYPAMYHVLGDAGDALAGRVVANLSSDTPQAARAAAGWLAERGAELVVGGVMVPPELVGTDAAYVFYSGPRSVFEAHEPALRVVGRPDYRGEDHGLAQLFYQAQLTVFLTAGAAFIQAAALLGEAGVPARDYAPLAADVIGLLAGALDETARQIDAADFPGEYGTAAMMAASADHIAGAAAEAGLDPTLPAAVQALYGRLVAAGHGKDSPNQVVEVIRKKIG